MLFFYITFLYICIFFLTCCDIFYSCIIKRIRTCRNPTAQKSLTSSSDESLSPSNAFLRGPKQMLVKRCTNCKEDV